MPWLEVEDPISACNGQPEGWLNRVCKGKWRGVGERALRGPYHVLESSSHPNLKKHCMDNAWTSRLSGNGKEGRVDNAVTAV